MAEATATTDKVTREKVVLTAPPSNPRVTIYEKASGKPLEVFAVDAQEILSQENSLYTADKPETKAAPAKESK